MLGQDPVVPEEGRTIVFVTHAADLVRQICDHAVMLQKGVIYAAGDPDDVSVSSGCRC
jgi:ABC-type polysaccharide/polyol phosphate transport system ATPase subunit